jgi:hypothetical protein
VVISKEVFNNLKTTELVNQWKLVEQYIDTRLNSGKLGYFHVSDIQNLIGRDLVENMIKKICEEYKKAGWNVKRESGSDPRDGGWDYLTFS